MNYNEFITYTEENKEESLKKISLIITNNVSKWLEQNFNIKLQTNNKYPMNGFIISKISDHPNKIKIEYNYKYGSLICEFRFSSDQNEFNLHELFIDKNIIKNFGFCNECFDLTMNNDFELKYIVNNIKSTMFKKGNHVSSYFEIDEEKNTKKKIISFNNGVTDTVHLEIEKDNNFYIDFHYIINGIYGKVKDNAIKTDLFPDYKDITNSKSFESFFHSFQQEYETEYEKIQEKIKIIEMLTIF